MAQTETKPAIPEYIAIVPHGPNVVEFRNGTWQSTSIFLTDESETGNLYRVCASLDGSRTIGDIAALTQIPADNVSEVVDTLVGLNLAEVDGSGLLRLGTSALLGADFDRIAFKHKEVVVIGDAEVSELVIEALSLAVADIGISLSSIPNETVAGCRAAGATYDAIERERALHNSTWMKDKFIIYCGSHVDPLGCKALNLCFIHHKTPWLFAAVDGPFVLIGPLFVPGDTPCFECFETRIAMNLRDSKGYVDYKQALAAGLSIRPKTSQISKLLHRLLAGHVAVEAFNFILSGRSTLADKMLAVHLPSMEFSEPSRIEMPPSCTSV
jgi:bacteriocin biosynthesis cyclodehydratase domain-containing protein